MPTEQPSRFRRLISRAALLPNGGGLTDGELLESFVSRRDPAAFEALVRRHGPMVLGVCRRVLHNAQDAEDAFQAVFLVLLRKAASIRQRELVANWLYGVAYRTALDARAASLRRRRREKQVGTMPEPPTVEVADDWRELWPLIDRELSRLPEYYRVAVVLCDLEGRTRRDVARELGIPVGTLSGRLTTARALLAQRLACRGLAFSGGALAAVLTQGAATAGVPATLTVSTVAAATAIVAGQPASGVVSAPVAALLKGGTRSMLTKTLVAVLAVLLAVGVLVGLGLHRPQAIAEPGEKAEQPARPRMLKLDSRGRRVVWSPDGKTLAVVTKNESLLNRKGSAIKLWDVDKGQMRAKLVEDAGGGLAFQHVAFSPDGKSIAATVSEEVVLPNVRRIRSVLKVWDAKTLALKQTLGNNDSHVIHVAFSPDGKLIAACDPSRKTITLWNAGTGALERTLDVDRAQPWAAAFSPDSKTLVVGAQRADHSGVVLLWTVDTGKLQHSIEQEQFVTAVAFSPDGKLFAASAGTEEVQVWSVEKAERVVSLKGNGRTPRTITFLSNSKVLAVGGHDGKVRLWDARTGTLSKTLDGHTDEVYWIACSPDGKTLASVSQDETLRLWPIKE